MYAPSNAYVFYSYGGYSGLGYIGNTTEAGVKNGGNQIILMSEVDDIVYGIIFLHLKDVYYNIGDIVHTGDIVGTAGQTGSADAPHLHVELYVLGPGHLSDYINNHYDYYFNVPRIYSNDINVYPYRTNPENVWN